MKTVAPVCSANGTSLATLTSSDPIYSSIIPTSQSIVVLGSLTIEASFRPRRVEAPTQAANPSLTPCFITRVTMHSDWVSAQTIGLVLAGTG